MKKLVLIGLMMMLGLSGCACTETCGLIKADWTEYWNNPGDGTWGLMKHDWVDFWS